MHTLMGMFARHRTQRDDSARTSKPAAADGHGGSLSSGPGRTPRFAQLARLTNRIGGYFAARSPRCLAGLFAVVLGVVILLLPSPYVIQMPGPTQDVLGSIKDEDVIAVSGKNVTTYRDSGKLLLVTVNASGVPGYPIINAQAVWAWANPRMQVTPREAVVPVGQTAHEYKKKTSEDMTSSQDSASAAGLAYAKNHADELGIDPDTLANAKVSMHVDSIGGPSAGMMYTLGLIDKLTPAKESGGRTIAGTGTIDGKGKIGKIGGIRLKMLGAKRDGATWFLAPASNCSEVVGHVPEGLRDVKVSTLDEAYQALVAIGKGQADDLPHCDA